MSVMVGKGRAADSVLVASEEVLVAEGDPFDVGANENCGSEEMISVAGIAVSQGASVRESEDAVVNKLGETSEVAEASPVAEVASAVVDPSSLREPDGVLLEVDDEVEVVVEGEGEGPPCAGEASHRSLPISFPCM